ncbi:hypothetical protein U0070_016942, partial [Myodes glareolus]
GVVSGAVGGVGLRWVVAVAAPRGGSEGDPGPHPGIEKEGAEKGPGPGRGIAEGAAQDPHTEDAPEEDLEGKTEEEIEMMKLMGFASFDSTKGKKVDGSVNAYAINVSQKRKYRQYMNRKGGFNRPLDFIA